MIPYRRILPIAAFQRSVFILRLMSGSWKALCFTTCHVFFALVIRSSVAFVVEWFRLIVCPRILPCVWNLMFLYFSGRIVLISRVLWQIHRAMIRTLSQFILMLQQFPVCSKVVNLGYMSSRLLILIVTSSAYRCLSLCCSVFFVCPGCCMGVNLFCFRISFRRGSYPKRILVQGALQ